jgi:hypothetical protein
MTGQILLNRAWASVQRSCFKSSEANDKAVVRNMKKAGLIIILNPAHDPVDFDNLNAEVFADYMVYLAEAVCLLFGLHLMVSGQPCIACIIFIAKSIRPRCRSNCGMPCLE